LHHVRKRRRNLCQSREGARAVRRTSVSRWKSLFGRPSTRIRAHHRKAAAPLPRRTLLRERVSNMLPTPTSPAGEGRSDAESIGEEVGEAFDRHALCRNETPAQPTRSCYLCGNPSCWRIAVQAKTISQPTRMRANPREMATSGLRTSRHRTASYRRQHNNTQHATQGASHETLSFTVRETYASTR